MSETAIYFDCGNSVGVLRIENEHIRQVLCDDIQCRRKFKFYDRGLSRWDDALNQQGKLNFGLKRVVFHDPATIAFWEDGTKTVVKCCEGDQYNKETGLAMCVLKRLMGEAEYKKFFRRWCK